MMSQCHPEPVEGYYNGVIGGNLCASVPLWQKTEN